jgi:hypothetical protein
MQVLTRGCVPDAEWPTQAPRSADVDFRELGRRFDLTGGEIKSAVFRYDHRRVAHPEWRWF